MTDITIEVINPENMGVVVGIVFLASPEAEVHLKWELFNPLNLNVSKITSKICGLLYISMQFDANAGSNRTTPMNNDCI